MRIFQHTKRSKNGVEDMANSIDKMVRQAKSRRVRKRVLALLAVVTVFLTSTGLRYEVIAMDREPNCGLLEHMHTEACLDDLGALICGLDAHVHTDACYQDAPYAPLEAEIEAPLEAIEAPVEELEAMELEAVDEYVPEDALPIEAETPAPEFVYDMNGADRALLSDVLAAAGLEVGLVDEVGESVLSDDQVPSIAVERRDGDYAITALRDFIDDDRVELAIFAADGGVYTVLLANGVVPVAATATPEPTAAPTDTPEPEYTVAPEPMDDDEPEYTVAPEPMDAGEPEYTVAPEVVEPAAEVDAFELGEATPSGKPTYNIEINLYGETGPFSLTAWLADAIDPEADDAPASEWTIAYNDTLFEVLPDGEDWQVMPIGEFDETEIDVDTGAALYAVALTNAAPGMDALETGVAVIRPVDGDLPAEAEGHADVLDADAADAAWAQIENWKGSQLRFERTFAAARTVAAAPSETRVQAFDIGLDNVDPETYAEGFAVTVTLPEAVCGRDFRLYHIHGDGDIAEIEDFDRVGHPVDDVTEVVTAFTFTTDRFSEFVLVYTVDFTYNGYTYHMPGGSRMLLSSLLDILQTGIAIDDVAEVAFSDPALVDVLAYADAHDWMLRSLQPFDTQETLTLTLQSGEQTIIYVTDEAQEASDGTMDITHLLTKVGVYEKQDGTWVSAGDSDSADPVKLRGDKEYYLEFSLAEVLKANGQFSDDATPMRLYLPDGVQIVDAALNGKEDTLTINLGEDGEFTGSKVKYVAKSDSDPRGYIEITWNANDSTQSDKFDVLTASAFADITLRYKVNITTDTGSIKFNESTTLNVTPDNSFDVHATKKGEFEKVWNETTNKFDARVNYTVTVTTDGNASPIPVNENKTPIEYANSIKVSDRINGDLLVYDPNSLVVTRMPEDENTQGETKVLTLNEDFRIITENPESTNGFDLEIISDIQDNEKVVITYSADVDKTKLGNNMGTAESTGNSVAVEGSDSSDTDSFDMEGKLEYVGVDKLDPGTETKKTVDGKEYLCVPWTIKYNDEPIVSVKGATLTDTLASDAINASMYDTSDGAFVVKVYDVNGGDTPIKVLYPEWGDGAGQVHKTDYDYTLGSNDNVKVAGSKWEWTIPDEADYGGTGPYSYVITYNTLINENLYGKFDFKNTVEESKTHNADAATYTYQSNEQHTHLTVEKKALEVTQKYIKWQVKIPRQEVPLRNAYLTDIHPNESGYYEWIVTDANEARSLGITDTNKLIDTTGLITAEEGHPGHEEMSTSYTSKSRTMFHFYYYTGDVDASGQPVVVDCLQARGVGNGKENIVITYYTKVDDNWLRRTMSEGLNQDHVNKVQLQANNQYAESSDKAVPRTPDFKKIAEKQPVGTAVVDGVPMDKLKFTLILKGIDDKKGDGKPVNDVLYSANNWFDESDNLVIEDVFDASLKMLGLDDGSDKLILYQDIPAAKEGETQKTIEATWKQEDITVEGKAKKKVTITIPKEKFGGTYGLVYSLPYYMTYASLQAAQSLSQEKMTGEGKTRYTTFGNSAKVKGIETLSDGPINVTVDLKPIDKTAVKKDNGKWKYSIVINPVGATLNGGNDYRLTDSYENLAVDYLTMKIYEVDYSKNEENQKVDITKDILWSYHGNEGIFWLHDSKPYIIEYETWPVGKLGTSFVMTNTAEMLGFDDTVEQEVELSSEHSGTIRSYKLKLLKHADDAMGRGIENVVFQLFMLNDAGERVPVTYDADYDKNGAGLRWTRTPREEDNLTQTEFASPDSHNIGDKYYITTDENGEATIFLNMKRDGVALEPGRQYYLKEVWWPEGYDIEDIYWSFVISDMDDFTSYVYRNGGVLKVSNDTAGGALILRKEFGGVDVPYSLKSGIQFRIDGYKPSDVAGEPDQVVFTRYASYSEFKKYTPTAAEGGTPYYRYRLPWNDSELKALSAQGKTVTYFKVTELSDTADMPTFSLATTITGDTGVEVIYESEKPVAAKVTMPDDENKDSNITTQFTNTYIPNPENMQLTVSKDWGELAKKKTDKAVKFALYKNGERFTLTAANGTNIDNGCILLNDANEWKATVTGLPRFDENNKEIVWTIAEVWAQYTNSDDTETVDGEAIVAEHFTTTAVNVSTKGGEPVKDSNNKEIQADATRKGTAWLVSLPVDRHGAVQDTNRTMRFTNELNELVEVEVK